jgi:2-polyprenyl-3-methyl-5-hydroxy-6-metoxy-1,4-benzoquinol methylase
MPDFRTRSTEDEMMDDFSLGHGVIDPIMDELEVVNAMLGGYRVFFNAFGKVDLKDGMTISDWGCGGGDSLRRIALWARRKNLKLSFVGIDATPAAVEYAREKSRGFPEITYVNSDVMSEDLISNQFDIVISSLFTHHFKDAEWIKLILRMSDCASTAVIVNDLHRHWFAYHSIGILTSVLSKSEMVKHDSKVSVMRSFKSADIDNMLSKAGIEAYTLKWMWAFRWQLCIDSKKPG